MGTGTFSAIDLSFCHPSLLLDFSWHIGEDVCHSDHYPIFLENDNIPERVPTFGGIHMEYTYTSQNPGNRPKPWYNDNCQRACSERIDTFKEFSKNPSGKCLTKYKVLEARSRRTC